ncbi:hypothetical protein ANRL1_03652 [Anaerolineae bacterium]|nr:hypothetical protein ANRL1_03652 [Anaerolineae bacterium]
MSQRPWPLCTTIRTSSLAAAPPLTISTLVTSMTKPVITYRLVEALLQTYLRQLHHVTGYPVVFCHGEFRLISAGRIGDPSLTARPRVIVST